MIYWVNNYLCWTYHGTYTCVCLWCREFIMEITISIIRSTSCGIIRIHGGSIFVEFVGSPPSQIYILHMNKVRKSFLCFWNWQLTYLQNNIPTYNQNPTIHEDCSQWIQMNPQCIVIKYIVVKRHWNLIKRIIVSNFVKENSEFSCDH